MKNLNLDAWVSRKISPRLSLVAQVEVGDLPVGVDDGGLLDGSALRADDRHLEPRGGAAVAVEERAHARADRLLGLLESHLGGILLLEQVPVRQCKIRGNNKGLARLVKRKAFGSN